MLQLGSECKIMAMAGWTRDTSRSGVELLGMVYWNNKYYLSITSYAEGQGILH